MPAKAAKATKKAKPAAKVKDMKPKADATGGTTKVGHGRRRFKLRDPGG
jgi:hypothetical protein